VRPLSEHRCQSLSSDLWVCGSLRRLIVSCSALCENMLADMMASRGDGRCASKTEALGVLVIEMRFGKGRPMPRVGSRAANQEWGVVRLGSVDPFNPSLLSTSTHFLPLITWSSCRRL
jgi:hypothetical protein